MLTRTTLKHGWIMAEVITSLTVLGIILIALAIAINSFGRFNDYQLQRQRCTAAAQAQIDAISATGSPFTDAQITRFWPNVRCSIQISNGIGQWKGLSLVKVNSTTSSRGRKRLVNVELSRYILPRKEQAQ